MRVSRKAEGAECVPTGDGSRGDDGAQVELEGIGEALGREAGGASHGIARGEDVIE